MRLEASPEPTIKQKVNDKSISIDNYIKKSLINKTIVLFLLSIIPVTISLLYSHIKEKESSVQKAELAFKSSQNVLMNKIDNTIKQIAHTNGLRLFLQSSSVSRERDKYKLLTNIEILLLHAPIIKGIELKDLNNKKILYNGETSKLSIDYPLIFTNDFIDQYGEKIGSLIVHLDKENILSELRNSYYEIEPTKEKHQYHLLDFSEIDPNIAQIKSNIGVIITAKILPSHQWIYYFISLFILLFIYIFIAKKTFSKIIKPIKNIDKTIFSDNTIISEYSHIKELAWISKIISNIKSAKHSVQKKLISQYDKNNDKVINSLHYLKSSLASTKIIIDEELKRHSSYKCLSNNIQNIINKTADEINSFKSINNINKINNLSFSTIKDLYNIISEETCSNFNVDVSYNTIDSIENMFLPFSKEQLRHIITNIFANAIEANADNVLINFEFNKPYIDLIIENNGATINLDNINNYMSGQSSKTNGTGTGLSSINKLLLQNNSKIYFEQPSDNYNTRVHLELLYLNNNLDNIISHIKEKTTLSEIILYNQPLNKISEELRNELLITEINNEVELVEYLKLSYQSGIIENQIYIHDYSIYPYSNPEKYLKIIIDNKLVQQIS